MKAAGKIKSLALVAATSSTPFMINSTGLDGLLLVGFALFFATLTALPDLYARVRDGKRWVPVNAPPYAIGDDYHYYSLLNLIHRRLVNVFTGARLDVIPLATFYKFQIVGFLFNIIPYHVGYLFHDRRLGILLVRIWNTAWLMLALMVCSKLLLGALRMEASLVVLALSSVAFFLVYPVVLSYGARNSIWLNLSREDHIFAYAEANDLQRAMHMATTGHLFLWALALLFWCLSQGSPNDFFYLIPAGAGILLFYTYFPVAAVYGFFYFVGLVVDHQFLAAGGWLVICMGLSAVYFRTLSQDTIGKELFVRGNSEGKIFAFDRAQLGVVVVTLLLPLACYVFLKDAVTTPIFWLIFFGSGVFVVTTLAASHQGNRFWQRGALVVYQLFVVVTSIALLERYISCCGEWIAAPTLLLLVLVLAVYFYRNAVFLFDAGTTKSQNWIDVQHLSCECYGGSKLIATDSVEMSFYIYLYTGDSCLLKHYSIQNQGYQKHLDEFCLNFKVAGYELSEVLDLFSRHVEPKEWLLRRVEAAHDPYVAGLAKTHTLQFMATYMGYNQRILDDGVFDKDGFTERARELISTIWRDIGTREVPAATIIIDPDRGLRAALKAQPLDDFDMATYRNKIKSNFIFFDDLLRRYEHDSYIHKILFSLRLPYCVMSEIRNKQGSWTRLHDKQCYVEGIKKLIRLVFLRRSLSGNGNTVILGDTAEDKNAAASLNVNNVRILRSRSITLSNILLYKKIAHVLLVLSRSGCLKDKGYLIDDAIESVLLYDQVDLSGINIIIAANIVDYYYAIVIQKAIEQGIKTVKIEHFLINDTHLDNVLCEYYFYPSIFHKNIREKFAINKDVKYVEGGYINYDAISKYEYLPQLSPKIISFFADHGDLLGERDELYYIDEILSSLPDEDYVIYVKLHPRAQPDAETKKYLKYINHSQCKIVYAHEVDNYELISHSYFCVSVNSALTLEAKHLCNRSFFIKYDIDEKLDLINLNDFNEYFDVVQNRQALKLALSGNYSFKSDEVFLANYNMVYPHTKNKFIELLNTIQTA